MRSPWIDLLSLHHHVTPAALSWRPDAAACDCKNTPALVDVDVSELPLRAAPGCDRPACCA